MKQAKVLAIQPSTCPVGEAHDLWINLLSPLDQCPAGGMIAAVVPGRFDQELSQMAVAGFGDTSLATFVPTGSLGGDQAKEGHELPRGGKSAEVSNLADEAQRGESLDAFEGS